MLVNTKWLRDYLVADCPEQDLLEAFMAVGLEVEDTRNLKNELSDVLIGFIRDKQPLDGADGMYACRVEIDKGKLLDIVCASEHPLEVGWGVPVAQAGVTLPTGVEIKEGRFRGNPSEGMVCLDGELGLIARSTGLQVFQDESTLGASLPSVAPIEESIVELSILPNRPDCLGMIGIAREVAAVLGTELKYPCQREIGGDRGDTPSVLIEDSDLCRRYVCQVFEKASVRKSPHWLKSRLQSAGQRPISNVVDVTNFVMLEWGQPLHAFDYRALAGGRIEVRRMRSGERLELLDGTQIDGNQKPLVIADAERPIALAGIMGGMKSQTNENSRDILLEAACFDPVLIRQTSKSLGISSESAYRFERGTDPNSVLAGAFNRAAELLQDPELSNARPVAGAVDDYQNVEQRRVFQLTSQRVSSLLGINIADRDIKTCLSKLEMQCHDDLRVEVPTWRKDVNHDVVLVEDVARLRGYDNIELRPMQATATAGRATESDRFRDAISEFLVSNGFLECRTPPLTNSNTATQYEHRAGEPVGVINPTTNEMTTLRQSLIGSLIEVVDRNARRGVDHFRFFEVDRSFRQLDKEVVEQWIVCGLIGGTVNDAAWDVSEKEINFLHLKGLVQNLLTRAGVSDPEFRAQHAIPGYFPDETAVMHLAEDRIGVLGRVDAGAIHVKLRTRLPLYAFELNLSTMLEKRSTIRRFSGLARTPAITRDVSIAVPRDAVFASLLESLRESFDRAADVLANQPRPHDTELGQLRPRLERVVCVDVYQSQDLGPSQKSVTLRMTFRDQNHTLTSNDAQFIVDEIVSRFKLEHGATLR